MWSSATNYNNNNFFFSNHHFSIQLLASYHHTTMMETVDVGWSGTNLKRYHRRIIIHHSTFMRILLLCLVFAPSRSSFLGRQSCSRCFARCFAGTRDATTPGSSPVPPPPQLSLPIWSLATPCGRSTDGNSSTQSTNTTTSMNIVTFASAVSVAAPKYWMISLYYDTKTKDSFCESKQGVLQLLTPLQKDLVPILGKRSGYEVGYSKEMACREAGMPWVAPSPEFWGHDSGELLLLPQCASYLHVRLHSTLGAGDHLVTLCELVSTGSWDDTSQSVRPRAADNADAMDHRSVLYTGLLREEGVL